MAFQNSSISKSPTATTSTLLPPSASSHSISLADLDAQRAPYITTALASITICLTLLIALAYFALFSWAYRASNRNPKALNKQSGLLLQRYAPTAYAFIVLSSLIEVAIASWLVLQYRFNHNYPLVAVRTACRLLLFASCWTFLTASTYTLFFLHPAWSKHPVSSIGAQLIWLFVTFLFWIVGAGILNGSIPAVIDKSRCEGVIYCFQLRLLFSLAVIESLALTAATVSMAWLAWQSARQAMKRPSLRPLSLPLSTIMEADN